MAYKSFCPRLFALALGLLAPGVAAQTTSEPAVTPEGSFTLDDALRAARSHPRVAPARSMLRATEADADAAGRWSNPQLGVSYMRSFGFTTFDPQVGVPQVGVTQWIETSGLPGRRRRAALGDRDAARLGVDLARRSVELGVAARFIRLAVAHARRELLRDTLARTEALVAVVNARVAAGTAPGYERTRAALAVADARAAVGDAEAEVADARGALDVAVGPGAVTLRGAPRLDLVDAPPLAPLSELVAGLSTTRVDLQVSGARASAARARVEVAQAEALPGFALYGGLLAGQGYGEQGQRQVDFMVGVTVPLPVLNTGRDAVRAAEARAAAAREELEAERTEARARVEAAWRVAQQRRSTLEAFVAGGGEQDRLLRETSAAYRDGRIAIQALLDAHDAVRDARLRALELASAAREAEAALWDAVGRLPARGP